MSSNDIEEVQENINKCKHIIKVAKEMRLNMANLFSEANFLSSYALAALECGDLYEIEKALKCELDLCRIKLSDLRGD